MNVKLIFILLLAGCTGTRKDKPVKDTPDYLFESLELVDLQNKKLDLDQYEGKTIFLNVWATWCKPCIEEMPSIERAKNLLRNEKMVFILASGEPAEEIEAFRNAHRYNFDFVRIKNSTDPRIQALPTTFILNNARKLVFLEPGSRKWDEKENIDMLIKFANENE